MGYKGISAKHIDKIQEKWISKSNNLENLSTTLENKKNLINSKTLGNDIYESLDEFSKNNNKNNQIDKN